MSSFRDLTTAYIESGLSLAGQYFPSTTKRATKLTEPTDAILRWRVARHLGDHQNDLCRIIPHAGAERRDLTTWGRYIIAAETGLIDEAVKSGARKLVVAHMIGSVGLLGTNESVPHQPVFRTLPAEFIGLLPEEVRDRNHSAVVVRVGEGEYVGAFGTIEGKNSTTFQPIPTINLGNVETTPNALRRV